MNHRTVDFGTADFARRLIRWQRRHGRNDLPWQATRDPYLVWLSEVMLQQTQVATVIPYFERFRARFSDIAALASADEDEVLALWSGLGYYSRARNLHRAARMIVEEHGSVFPSQREIIETLPGIGRSTAAAIAAFAFGAREAILDGNVKRVLARHFAVSGWPGTPAVERKLWQIAEALLPSRSIEIYTQAVMDLGATVCTTRAPACDRCPVRAACEAHARDDVERFPAARPRRALPRKSTTMLVLVHQGEVLLEKRPPTGVWGALWCFPEIESGRVAKRVAINRYGCKLADTKALAPLAHSFTHFSLTIEPLLARATSRNGLAAEAGCIWLPLEDASAAAVPTPVRRILQSLEISAR